MARIEPFKGVLYNPGGIKEISRVVAPPYDMISPLEQKELYEKDPHNIVRLILGYQYPRDSENENRYTRAAAALEEWLGQSVLRRDGAPSIYIYDQEYGLSRGPRLKRRGFIALAALEELGQGSIYPHERTLSGPKEDRLKLMLACRANFSQIFSFYNDPAGAIDGVMTEATGETRFDFSDAAGVRHALHALTEPAAVDRIRGLMADKSLFIADGHHRYETALNFRRLMRQEMGDGYPAAYDYVMMYFVNMSSPGITILPFHRVVALPPDLSAQAVVDRIKPLGELIPVGRGKDRMADLQELLETMSLTVEGEHRFGIFAPPSFHLLIYRHGWKEGSEREQLVDGLDVSILHKVLLEEGLMGFENQAEIAYHTREKDILALIDKGSHQMVFFLNPTKIGQVSRIAGAGLRMPPKSTNFHPKLISGLVFNLLRP